jgi:carotenoid cleavage dioxygenase
MGYNLISLDFDAPRDEKTTDVVVGVVDKHGARTSRRVIKMSRPSMQHDVGITRSRVVLLDGPLVFDLDEVLTGGLPFAFETDQTMRIGILPRAAARVGENDEDEANENKEDVVWVDTGEPCFAYHVVNCYDDPADPDVVVVDVCKSDGTNALGMARGFDDDADGQGWMPAGSFVDGNKTKTKNKNKNGYVGDDATGVVDENAFEALVNKAVGFFFENDASSKERDPRDARRENAPELGSHANAVGHGRDVAALWRWRVDVRKQTMVSSDASVRNAVRLSVRRPEGRRRAALFLLHRRVRGFDVPEAAHGRPEFRQGAQARPFNREALHVLSGRKPRVRRRRVRPRRRQRGGAPAGADARRRAADDEGRRRKRSRGIRARKKNERSPTELLILADDRDERNPALRLVGKVKIPVRVPFGFHNEFVAEAELPQGKW